VSRNQGPGGMDPRIEELNQVDRVVKEENAGLLAAALEVVTIKDTNQWEEVEVDATERGAQNGTSEEKVARQRAAELPGKGKPQRRNRGDSPISYYQAETGKRFGTISIGRMGAEQHEGYDICPDSIIASLVFVRRMTCLVARGAPIRMLADWLDR
jgi:hypothetical protein